MPIQVTCNSCSSRLKAPDGAVGKKLKCPKCGAPITVAENKPVSKGQEAEPEFAFQFEANSRAMPQQRVEPEPDGEGEVVQNYPASVGTDLNNPLDRLGILLGVLWAVATLGLVVLGFAGGDETFTGLILVVFVGGGVAVGLFLRHAANTQCPKCKQLWAKEHAGSEGSEVYAGCYRCGHCRYRWRLTPVPSRAASSAVERPDAGLVKEAVDYFRRSYSYDRREYPPYHEVELYFIEEYDMDDDENLSALVNKVLRTMRVS